MATIREKRPGVWEVRVFTGRDAQRRPTQTVAHRARRQARGEAAGRAAGASGNRSAPAGRTVGDVLDAWMRRTCRPGRRRRHATSRAACGDQARPDRAGPARPAVGGRRRALARTAAPRRLQRRRRSATSTRVLRAALSQAVRWGWASSNVASLARLRSSEDCATPGDVARGRAAPCSPPPRRSTRPPRLALRSGRCRRRAPGRAGRVAVGRRARRFAHDRLRHRNRPARRRATRSCAMRPPRRPTSARVALDADTLALIDGSGGPREPYGPWMFGLGPELVNPDRIGWWWRRSRAAGRHRREVAPARSPPLVGHRRHRPGPRRPHRRRPPRPRQPGDDAAGLRPRRRGGRSGCRGQPRRGAEGRAMRPLVLRDEDPPDDAVILVRGGVLSPDSVHRTVERCRREYGFLGLSVYGAIGMTVAELVIAVPQIGPTRYRQVRLSTFGAVRSAGFPVWPTNQHPALLDRARQCRSGHAGSARRLLRSAAAQPAVVERLTTHDNGNHEGRRRHVDLGSLDRLPG